MRKLAFLLALAGSMIGSIAVAPTAKANHPDCSWAGSARFASVGQVFLSGAPFGGNKGIAADQLIFDAYLEVDPYRLDENLYLLYASTAPNLGTYTEFGWARRRNPTYTAPFLTVVVNGAQVWSDLDDNGVINYPLAFNTWRRFKMWYNVATLKWTYEIGNPGGTNYQIVHQRQVNGLGSSSYLWAAQEVLNTCSAGKADFRDTWRFSTANNAWIEIGKYKVMWDWPSQYQKNPFHYPAYVADDYWRAVCVKPFCHTYA